MAPMSDQAWRAYKHQQTLKGSRLQLQVLHVREGGFQRPACRAECYHFNVCSLSLPANSFHTSPCVNKRFLKRTQTSCGMNPHAACTISIISYSQLLLRKHTRVTRYHSSTDPLLRLTFSLAPAQLQLHFAQSSLPGPQRASVAFLLAPHQQQALTHLQASRTRRYASLALTTATELVCSWKQQAKNPDTRSRIRSKTYVRPRSHKVKEWSFFWCSTVELFAGKHVSYLSETEQTFLRHKQTRPWSQGEDVFVHSRTCLLLSQFTLPWHRSPPQLASYWMACRQHSQRC